MDYKLFSSVLFLFLVTVTCQNLDNKENATSAKQLNIIEGTLSKERAQGNLAYVSLITCAVSSNPACLVDAAGKLFEIKKNELLAQADLDAFRATGRADPDNTPSHVAKTVEQLISQLSGLFKDTLFSFFSAKEADDDDEIVDPDDKGDGSSRGVSGDSSKKKKKPLKTLFSLIKVALLVGIVVAKVTVLIKLFEAAVKFKFLLIALGGLLIHGVKLWMDLKSKKHNEENIVFKNPYEHGGDWNSAGPGGPVEYNARSYNIQKGQAQNLAYSRYIPV